MSDCQTCYAPTSGSRAFCPYHWNLLDVVLQREFMAAAKLLRKARSDWNHYSDPDGVARRAAGATYRDVRGRAVLDIRLRIATTDSKEAVDV